MVELRRQRLRISSDRTRLLVASKTTVTHEATGAAVIDDALAMGRRTMWSGTRARLVPAESPK